MKVAGPLSVISKSGRSLGGHNKLFENVDGQEIQSGRSSGRKLADPKLLKWTVQFSV